MGSHFCYKRSKILFIPRRKGSTKQSRLYYFLSFLSFSYSPTSYLWFRLSLSDIIVFQKSSSQDGKFTMCQRKNALRVLTLSLIFRLIVNDATKKALYSRNMLNCTKRAKRTWNSTVETTYEHSFTHCNSKKSLLSSCCFQWQCHNQLQ